MSILSLSLQGRYGNQCLQFLFAYAFAQKHGMEFRCPEWIGERIFDLPKYERPDGTALLRVNELEIDRTLYGKPDGFNCVIKKHPLPNLEFRGYAQMQRCMIYSKREAQAWFKVKPEIVDACKSAINVCDTPGCIQLANVVCHRRRGDYVGYGYPVVSRASYGRACRKFGIKFSDPDACMLSEEFAIWHRPYLPDDLSFMPDFYRMMTAPTLLRANSSFSWLAALLGNGLVLSPIVDGKSGDDCDCEFVAGNHPKFTGHLDFVENLYVRDI